MAMFSRWKWYFGFIIVKNHCSLSAIRKTISWHYLKGSAGGGKNRIIYISLLKHTKNKNDFYFLNISVRLYFSKIPMPKIRHLVGLGGSTDFTWLADIPSVYICINYLWAVHMYCILFVNIFVIANFITIHYSD